ncbi:hypothetical protein [Pelosinus sp. IPA-1]|nr:hypothetical protein [Pelosinus sp. IPA-1]GMA99556.1 hypothetical protein PIPA1_23560 [Pelosinus sp. IPA-1]
MVIFYKQYFNGENVLLEQKLSLDVVGNVFTELKNSELDKQHPGVPIK